MSIRHYTVVLLLCLPAGAPTPAAAFEKFDHRKNAAVRCQTACHQPANVIRTQQDKTGKPECQECHGNVAPALPPSPFLSPALLATADAKPLSAARKSKTAPVAPPPPDMALIPAGEFIMGSNERWDDETPEYVETTGAFYMDIYELTNAEYKKFVDATRREPPYHWPDGKIPARKENHPVTYVNWNDAKDYCAWAGKRLPTEEEWEKAARGTEGFIYPWGNEWDMKKSNNPYKHSTGTEPVGSYPAGKSPYGLYDMSGNVWEWVDSFYLPHPGNTIPKPEYGKDKRILKGGSWFDCLSYGCGLSAPTFNRAFFTPEVRNNSFGFRCAKTAKK